MPQPAMKRVKRKLGHKPPLEEALKGKKKRKVVASSATPKNKAKKPKKNAKGSIAVVAELGMPLDFPISIFI